MLVDHIAELELPAIGPVVELEVHGLDLLRVPGLVTPHRAVNRAYPVQSLVGPVGWGRAEAAAGPARAKAAPHDCGSYFSLPAAAGGGPSDGPRGCTRQ